MWFKQLRKFPWANGYPGGKYYTLNCSLPDKLAACFLSDSDRFRLHRRNKAGWHKAGPRLMFVICSASVHSAHHTHWETKAMLIIEKRKATAFAFVSNSLIFGSIIVPRGSSGSYRTIFVGESFNHCFLEKS